MAISPDDRRAFSAAGGLSEDRTLRFWDVQTGQCLRTLPRRQAKMHCIALSNDSQWAISGGDDHTLEVWELEWDYEFPGWADWHEGATSFLQQFLAVLTAGGQPALTPDGPRA